MSQSWHLKHSCGACIQTPGTIQLCHHLQLRRALGNTVVKTTLVLYHFKSYEIIQLWENKRGKNQLQTCAFFSKSELSVRGKDRGLTEGQTMCLYECKAVQILSLPSSKSLPKHKSLKLKHVLWKNIAMICRLLSEVLRSSCQSKKRASSSYNPQNACSTVKAESALSTRTK
jgi:hypothetical protein